VSKEPKTHEQVWRETHPRPEWDDPEHWSKCRPNYEEVNDDVRKREVSD
jgi:hypothetical protein